MRTLTNTLRNLYDDAESPYVVNIRDGSFAQGMIMMDGDTPTAVNIWVEVGDDEHVVIKRSDFSSDDDFAKAAIDKIARFTKTVADFMGHNGIEETRWQFTREQLNAGWGTMLRYQQELEASSHEDLLEELSRLVEDDGASEELNSVKAELLRRMK